MIRLICCAWLWCFAVLPPLQAADPPEVKTGFDLIPINTAAGFAIHDLKELQTQGDAFLKNTGLEQEFGIRPSQAVEWVFGYLGISRGRDDTRPAGVFIANLIEARVLNPFENNSFEDVLVVAVAFSDRDEIASNFGLNKGELQPEQITKSQKVERAFGKLIYVRGDHLYLGNNERAVLSVARGKPLSEVLTEKQQQRGERSDMLLHLGTSPWGGGWAKFVQQAKEQARELETKGTDPDTGLSAEMLQLLADSLTAVQNVLVTVSIDDKGFEFNSLAIFRAGEHASARKLLALLQSGEEASSLKALPKQNLIAAQAVRSDGSQNRVLVRDLLKFALEAWIREDKLLAVADRPNFVGLFDEVWQRLKGSQFAVYRNGNPASEGLFSIVAILDTADPKEFLSEMRQLARFANPGEMKLEGDDREAEDVATVEKLIKELGDPSFRVRESATLKLSLIGPPALPYLDKAAKSKDREVSARARRVRQRIENAVEARRQDVVAPSWLSKLSARWGDFPNAETRRGVPVDIVKMELQGQSQTSKTKLQETFGPDWSKIRLAVQGQKIVVLMGSNVDLIDETIANLQKQQAGLVDHPSLTEFHSRAPESRGTEFHMILQQFVPLVQGTKAEAEATADMTSLSLGIDDDTIELHLWVPNREFRAFRRFR